MGTGMRPLRIVPVVEGDGEERAVPLLVRRWLRHRNLIERLLGCSYEERVHQLRLTGGLTFSSGAAVRSASYGKLLRDLDRLTREARRRRAA
jgi:hypothetical protein